LKLAVALATAADFRERDNPMTDSGADIQPELEEVAVPFRPRSTYVGYKAFGSGDGAALVEPQVSRELRHAAELATLERRITGGLLYGRIYVDEGGEYLVIDGYLEAGPGESLHDKFGPDGADNFTLSEPDLRLQRDDAARMYAGLLELGWWRSLPVIGEFGPQDLETQSRLVEEGGVGLLVYGSGLHWGTAYLGPEGLAPDSAGTLVPTPTPTPTPAPAPASEPPSAPALGAGRAGEPELVNVAAGESLVSQPPQGTMSPSAAIGTQAPPRGGRWARAPREGQPRQLRQRQTRVRVPNRVRVARPASPPGYPPKAVPNDVQFVIGAIALVIVVAAIIIGVLASSVIVAVIIAVIGLLALSGSMWMARR
jgi:hypothetical protein